MSPGPAVAVVLPPEPAVVPELVADVGSVREFAADLLAASAQVDDTGGFAAGGAKVAGWTGLASDAYHAAVRPTGARADAMSAALRAVARRADAHADALAALLQRRAALTEHRGHLVRRIADLRDRARGAPASEAAAIRAACDDCALDVRGFTADLEGWARDVAAEERSMSRALARSMTLDQDERRHDDGHDPADAALDTFPGPGATPARIKAWWDSLTRQQQLAVIPASPGSIGNLDGIPPWARDAANRVALDRDLAEWEVLADRGLLGDQERRWLDNARAAQDARALIERELDPVTGLPIVSQLYLYDPAAFDGDGAVAISAGDLGTADNTAVVVPGFGTDGRSAPFQADRTLDLYDATRSLDPSQTNATVVWIGYDAPDNAPWEGDGDWSGVLGEGMASDGGDRLADTLDGLRDSRDGGPAHLTVIGHSYGSTTLGHAAHDEGVAVDDLVLVGSPGAGGDTDHASDLGVAPEAGPQDSPEDSRGHVWVGSNSRDPIADLGNHGWLHLETLAGGGLGDDPAEDDFGGTRFEAESTTRAEHGGPGALADHSTYFDPDTESLFNISQIVNGHYDAVLEAPPVTDPWWTLPQDPEWDRDPTSPDTDPAPGDPSAGSGSAVRRGR